MGIILNVSNVLQTININRKKSETFYSNYAKNKQSVFENEIKVLPFVQILMSYILPESNVPQTINTNRIQKAE